MALLVPGCPDARGCSLFLRLTLLFLGNYAPTSCLCPDARAPSSCRTRMPRGDRLRPCRYRPPLPVPATEQRSIPLLPSVHARCPNSCSMRLWQGRSHCNMCNILIYV